jgi:hypothetical protein
MTMKCLSVYVHLDHNGETRSNATIAVDGIGEVKIKCAISSDLAERIQAEATAALRAQFGQYLNVGVGETAA